MGGRADGRARGARCAVDAARNARWAVCAPLAATQPPIDDHALRAPHARQGHAAPPGQPRTHAASRPRASHRAARSYDGHRAVQRTNVRAQRLRTAAAAAHRPAGTAPAHRPASSRSCSRRPPARAPRTASPPQPAAPPCRRSTSCVRQGARRRAPAASAHPQPRRWVDREGLRVHRGLGERVVDDLEPKLENHGIAPTRAVRCEPFERRDALSGFCGGSRTTYPQVGVGPAAKRVQRLVPAKRHHRRRCTRLSRGQRPVAVVLVPGPRPRVRRQRRQRGDSVRRGRRCR